MVVAKTTVGVLGGGQLGRMLMESANNLNVSMVILDKQDAPATHVNAKQSHVAGDFRSAEDIERLAQKCNILTVEIEHVDVDALSQVQKMLPDVQIHPSPATIAVIQDKFLQKKHLQAHGVPLPEFKEADAKDPVNSVSLIAKEFGYPIMLKSKRMAYDGRGNAVIRTESDIATAIESLGGSKTPLYLEKWVPFTKELAVMVAKDQQGCLLAYPVVETIQKNNICHLVIAPAQIPAESIESALQVATKAIGALEGCGIFGVEMFLLPDGQVLLNEIAPRPHNSGHYTIEACHTSQFEQHLRIITNLPMGSPQMRVPYACMINLLGEADGEQGRKILMDTCHRALLTDTAAIHLYGKEECKRGRKMGHITVLAESYEQLLHRVSKITGSKELQHTKPNPLVGIIMGSDSDLPVMKAAALILQEFNVPFELTIVSAHRTPDRLMAYGKSAHKRGLKCIISGAGGAAHLPGMTAAVTPLPVIGVPVALKHLDGVDSLYSICQMPRGVPVATVAINNATNAGLLAIRILAASAGDMALMDRLMEYRDAQEAKVMAVVDNIAQKGWENH